jgi:hypothetical protein
MAPTALRKTSVRRDARPAAEEPYDSPTAVRILAIPESLSGGDLLPGFVWPLANLFLPSGTPQPT